LDNEISLQSLIEDVMMLAKKEARGKPPKVHLSERTAELLLAIGEKPEAREVAPASAAPREKRDPVAAELFPSTGETATVLRELGGEDGESNRNRESELALIADEVMTCAKCPLAAQRKRPVPGEGHPRASLVFVGEAPGAEEDRTGHPFVGRAGNLLTDIIVKGMKMKRDDVFICNVLKCRPPNNRTPNPEEVAQCEPYLLRQLEVIRPKVICALGATAAQTLLKTNESIKRLRGIWHDYHGIPFRVTYHPAYLLRNPTDKRKTWEDIQEIMRLLSGEVIPEL